MLPDLAFAVRLQGLDRLIKDVESEIATLPKHVAEIEKKLDSHQRKLEADRAAITANQRDRKKLEGDIQVQEQKISKLKSQTLEAKNNEQYRAFQNEISYCEGEIRKAEDKILELMEQSEPLEKNVKVAEASLKEEQKQVEAEKATAKQRTAVDQKQLAEFQAERKTITDQMDPKVVATYERLKKSRGKAVADATEGRCDACQIAPRPQFFQDLRRGDQIMFCESCGRMLTYNPPVSFEADLEPSAHKS